MHSIAFALGALALARWNLKDCVGLGSVGLLAKFFPRRIKRVAIPWPCNKMSRNEFETASVLVLAIAGGRVLTLAKINFKKKIFYAFADISFKFSNGIRRGISIPAFKGMFSGSSFRNSMTDGVVVGLLPKI